MPFLFQRIADYTELLMPDDLLSGVSIVTITRETMTPDVCRDVEVIGWLYQFYISEKKDEVFDGMKKGKKITPENIPAATQLFTPSWIVCYLVENSLGRLWMLNRPQSKLIEKMDYYIRPDQVETKFLRVSSPDEIKICDPACGSGHMLVYAFDLLYEMYEEDGYPVTEIPERILRQNLFGIEIDERAGELAAFALTMKARSKYDRYLRKTVQPNVCMLQNVRFTVEELRPYMDFADRSIFTDSVRSTLRQFEEADNFGSLIRPELADPNTVRTALSGVDTSGQLFLDSTHQKVLRVLEQAEFLRAKYHVVVANPPYMGGKGMNGRLASWLKENFADVKSDLFAAFIVRNTELTLNQGQLGFMTPFVWMFISSYEALRSFLIDKQTITSLVQLEYSGFDGATVPICAFTIQNSACPEFRGSYIRLSEFRGAERQGPKTLEAIRNPACGWFYRVASRGFKAIPGSPIAYWVGGSVQMMFSRCSKTVGDIANPNQALVTGNTDLYIRKWFEVSLSRIGLECYSREQASQSRKRWFPYNKGGDFRNWYGDAEHVVDWENDGLALQTTLHPSGNRVWAHNFVLDSIFKEAIVWSKITSGRPSFRYSPRGRLFDDASGVCSFEAGNRELLLGLMCSKVNMLIQQLINPTLNIQPANLRAIPLPPRPIPELQSVVGRLLELSKADSSSQETSLDS